MKLKLPDDCELAEIECSKSHDIFWISRLEPVEVVEDNGEASSISNL